MHVLNRNKHNSAARSSGRLLALPMLILVPVFAQAATYYVDKAGSDSNPCTATAPCRTIQKGLSVISGGDTLVIGDGTYAETSSLGVAVLANPPSGTAGRPTVIKAAHRNQAVIKCPNTSYYYPILISVPRSYITFDGIVADGLDCNDGGEAYAIGADPSLTYSDIHHIIIQNGTGRNALNDAGIVMGGENNQVLNMDLYDNYKRSNPDWRVYGLYLSGRSTLVEGNRMYNNSGFHLHQYIYAGRGLDNNVIRNNVFYGKQNSTRVISCVILSNGDNTLFYNNVLHDCHIGLPAAQGGVFVYGNATNTKIYNNTIYGNQGYCVTINPGVTGTIVKNNICYMNSAGVISDSGYGTVVSDNLQTNPSFVDAPSDFHLRSGSPAIGGGTNLYSTFTIDFDGQTRSSSSAWDIGAFTYGGFAAAPPSAPTHLRIGSTN
jgi:hypothetical protein